MDGKKDNWKWRMNMLKTYTPLETIKKQINKEQIDANISFKRTYSRSNVLNKSP